jgi:hypothetical protein
MKTLSEIYLNYSSFEGHGDKGTTHSYIQEYERILKPYRYNSTVLEIGLYMGESLKMWNEYFVYSEIIGVDITDRYLKNIISENKYNIIISDATTPQFLNTIPDKTFDVIIDDASHKIEDQIKTFNILKTKMKNNGVYIIEDVIDIEKTVNKFISLHNNYEVIDNRHIKNRHDDVLIVYKF